MRTLDDQGNWIEVPDPVAPVAPPPTGRSVTLIDDTGTPRTIDESEYRPAIEAGWREETPEENATRLEAERYGSFGEQVEGTLEEVARVGSFGLSDPIITGALEVARGREFADAERQRMLARGRQLGTAGKVVGTVGGIGLSAGLGLGRAGLAAEGLVARGLGGLGTGTVARAALGTGARLAAGGAVEGGLYGAGMGLSEASLEPGGNYDNLASRVLAGARAGAGFGAGAGAFLGTGGGAIGALGRKGLNYLSGPGGVKRLLEKTANESALRGIGRPTRSEVAAMGGEDGVLKLASEVRDHVMDDGSRVFTMGASKEKIAERIAKSTDEVGAKLGALRREVSDAIEATDVSLRPKLDLFFRGLDEMVDAARTGPRSELARVKSAVREYDGLRRLWQSGAATLDDVTQYRIRVDSIIRPPKARGGGVAVAKANADQLQAANRMLEGSITESLEGGISAVLPGRVAEYGPLKLRYKALAKFNQLAQKDAAAEFTRNRMNPFETLSSIGGTVAGIASGSFAPVAGGLAIAGARRLFSNRGESTLAVLAGRLAKYDGRISAGLTKFFGSSAPRKALAVGAREDVAASTGRTRDALRVRENEALAEAYRKRLQEVQGFNPESMRDVGATSKEAPGTAVGVVARQMRAREFLLTKAPRELLGDDPIQAHLRRPVPSRPELEKFARYLKTVEDPLSVIDDLNKGRLTREQVETLKAVDPAVFEDLQNAVMEKLSESTERLPYLKRIQLGMLLDIPTDVSLQPERIAMTQAIYAPVTPTGAMPPTASAPRAPRGKGTNGAIGKSLATASQANEGGMVEF